MPSIPAGIAAQQGLAQQNVALSVIKQSADAAQAVAGILEQSAQNIKVQSSGRGATVNLRA